MLNTNFKSSQFQICTLFFIKRNISKHMPRRVSFYATAVLVQIELQSPGSRTVRYRTTILLVVVHSLQLHCLQNIRILSKTFITFLTAPTSLSPAISVRVRVHRAFDWENCCFRTVRRTKKRLRTTSIAKRHYSIYLHTLNEKNNI